MTPALQTDTSACWNRASDLIWGLNPAETVAEAEQRLEAEFDLSTIQAVFPDYRPRGTDAGKEAGT